MSGFAPREKLVRHFVYSVRILRRNPGFALTAVLTLAIGIAANTTVFGVLRTVLLQPLSHPHSDELVMIEEIWPTGPGMTSYLNYLELKSRLQNYSELVALRPRNVQMQSGVASRRDLALEVTPNFFWTLGGTPLYGRFFTIGEDIPGKQPVAVLSEDLWRESFGADPNIIDHPVRIDGGQYIVVGVAPRSFRGDPFPTTGLWLAMQPVGPVYSSGAIALFSFARLKTGTTMAAANAELSVVMQNIREGNRDRLNSIGNGARAVSMQRWEAQDLAVKLPILMVAATFLVVIVFVNVANLLLAWTISRRREWATRLALGGNPWQIVEQVFALSCTLALAGLFVGLVLEFITLNATRQFAAYFLPYGKSVQMDLQTVLYGAGLCVLGAIVSGTAPALTAMRTTRLDLRASEQAPSLPRSQRQTSLFLVAIEIALSTALVCCAGLMLRTLYNLEKQDLGVQADNVLTFRFAATIGDYTKLQVAEVYYRPFLEQLRALPGVDSVGATNALPIYGSSSSDHIQAPGHLIPQSIRFALRGVMPGYFRSLGIEMIRGREFSDADRLGTLPVAVINDVAAQLVFGDEDPIGRQIGWGETIIGVYKSTAQGLRSGERLPEIDTCLMQMRPGSIVYNSWAMQPMTITVRTTVPPLTLRETIRKMVSKVNPGNEFVRIQTLRDEINRSVTSERLELLLIGTSGGLALLLAAVGVYGLISFNVVRQTTDIGIRMALGAVPSAIRRLVLRQALFVTAFGLVLGFALALSAGSLLKSTLYKVKSYDPVTFLVVAALISIVATLAALIPAQRAASMNLVAALRQE